MMNNKKKNILIVLVVAAVVLAVTAVIVVLSANSTEDNKDNNKPVATTKNSTTVEEETEPTTEYVQDTTEIITEETTEETTEEVTTTTEPTSKLYTLPTQGDTTTVSFTPYKCITPDGEVISDDFINLLGGSTSITLNEDGTYSFVLGGIVNSSGTYELDGNAIELSDGYSGTVSYDGSSTPIAVIISANDYQVYFN